MQSMLFDTHCHLNFKRFKKDVDEVITRAREVGVREILIPGTDVKTSRRAIEIAKENKDIYVAAGIHPHHVFDIQKRIAQVVLEGKETSQHEIVTQELGELESLLDSSCVVAVGEIGLDRHEYEETKYRDYVVDDDFISLQKTLMQRQIEFAITHKKSVVIHNREATEDLLLLLNAAWDKVLRGRTVFHCCEADERLLSFALEHGMYIGVDGDVTYDVRKQEFIKNVPLEWLVIETDAPFILPEPLRSERRYPNEPAYVSFVADCVAEIKGVSSQEIAEKTRENGLRLFGLE